METIIVYSGCNNMGGFPKLGFLFGSPIIRTIIFWVFLGIPIEFNN